MASYSRGGPRTQEVFYIKWPFWKRFPALPKRRLAKQKAPTTPTLTRDCRWDWAPQITPGGGCSPGQFLRKEAKLENLTRPPRKHFPARFHRRAPEHPGSGRGSLGRSTQTKPRQTTRRSSSSRSSNFSERLALIQSETYHFKPEAPKARDPQGIFSRPPAAQSG